MAINILLLLLGLVVILFAAALFTNAVEWLGKRLRLSEGAIGSVLAAVGTALPETLLPVVAILFQGGDLGKEIGTGAILGAPFMLATLAMFVTGLAAVIYRRRRPQGRDLCITASVMRRDLGFFLVLFCGAVGASFVIPAVSPAIPPMVVRGVIGALLLGGYVLYLVLTFRGGEATEHELEGLTLRLWFMRWLIRPEDEEEPEAFHERRHAHGVATPQYREISTQLVLALVGIIGGAWVFVHAVGHMAAVMGVRPLVLALIIAPVATELPEKFNSVIWVRQGKDTFALGNITGAMVFQSSIPVTLGIWLTPWNLQASSGRIPAALASAGIALAAAAFVWLAAGLGRFQERCATCVRRERPCVSMPSWAMVAGLGFWLVFVWGIIAGLLR